MISPNEVGLVLRFGKLTRSIHPPGLLFALPAPFDEVIRVPIKSVQEIRLDLWASQTGDNTFTSLNPVTQPYTLTGDVNIVRATFAVRYQVADPVNYALNTKDRTALCNAILYQAACRVLSSMNVEDALTVGKNYIGLEASRIAQAELDQLTMGIRLLAFETCDINPPTPVSGAFQAVVSAKVQAKTMLEEANAYQASILPNSKADAYRIQQDAESYAKQLITKAEGETSAFSALLDEYGANPILMRTRLQSEMLNMVMPKVKLSTFIPKGANTRILISPQSVKRSQSIKMEDETQSRIYLPAN